MLFAVPLASVARHWRNDGVFLESISIRLSLPPMAAIWAC